MKILKTFWKYWMKIAKPIGTFQARILFTLFYLVLFLPIGLFYRLFSDPLGIHPQSSRKKTGFLPWQHLQEGIEEARKPF